MGIHWWFTLIATSHYRMANIVRQKQKTKHKIFAQNNSFLHGGNNDGYH